MVTYKGREESINILLDTIDNMQFTGCFDLAEGWKIDDKPIDVKHLCKILR